MSPVLKARAWASRPAAMEDVSVAERRSGGSVERSMGTERERSME